MLKTTTKYLKEYLIFLNKITIQEALSNTQLFFLVFNEHLST